MITAGSSLTGTKPICQKLTEKPKTNVKQEQFTDPSDLQEFWNTEMTNGGDNDDDNDDIMESVKNKALETAMKRQESKPSRKKPTTSTTHKNDNVQPIKSDKISDLVGDDPMMQKFWDNKESTPGFGGEFEEDNNSIEF